MSKDVSETTARWMAVAPAGYAAGAYAEAAKRFVRESGCDWLADLNDSFNPMPAVRVEEICAEADRLTAENAALRAERDGLREAIKAAWIEGEWAGQQNREDTKGEAIEYEDSKAAEAARKEAP